MSIRSKAFIILFLTVFFLTSGLVILSYLFVDRELSTWVYEKNFGRFLFLKGFSEIAKYINGLAALSLIYFGIKRLWKKGKFKEQTFLAIALSSILSATLTDTLKAFFGRYWPATWVNNNPSWIQDKAYGFHFFQIGWEYASFPSGHTAIIVSVGTLIWLAFPKWRFLSILLIALEAIGLLGMNYHFFSDILAGAFIGWLTALFLHHYLLQSFEMRAAQPLGQ